MYRAFQNITTVTKTQTNIRLFLDDPATQNGEFKTYLTSILEGFMEVFTHPQVLSTWKETGPLYLLPWSVGEMPSEGDSDLGKITMTGNPQLLTTGVIRQNVPGQPYPAVLDAAVFQVFDVPGYGKLHNKYPVMIEGTVDTIPPFHTACGCNSAFLFDEHDKMRGVIGGRSLTLMGPG
jgi:hypothetical protein